MAVLLRYLGLGNEGTPGTPVDAQVHLDITSTTLDTPTDTELYHEGGVGGRGIRSRKPGFYQPSGNVVYDADLESIVWLLRYAFGSYAFTPGSPNVHEVYASNDNVLPAFTARVGKDLSNLEHMFQWCALGQLQLQVSDGFLVATADITAQQDAPDTLVAEASLLLPSVPQVAFHEITATLPDPTDASPKIRSLTWTINNNLRTTDRQHIGSRFAEGSPAGGRDVTFSADLWFEDRAELERFWGGASGPAAAGATSFGMVISGAVGADTIDIAMNDVHYTQVQTQPSGRDPIIQSVAGRALVATHTLDDTITDVETEALVTVNNTAADVSTAGTPS